MEFSLAFVLCFVRVLNGTNRSFGQSSPEYSDWNGRLQFLLLLRFILKTETIGDCCGNFFFSTCHFTRVVSYLIKTKALSCMTVEFTTSVSSVIWWKLQSSDHVERSEDVSVENCQRASRHCLWQLCGADKVEKYSSMIMQRKFARKRDHCGSVPVLVSKHQHQIINSAFRIHVFSKVKWH